MTAGDVISGIGGDNAVITYQPTSNVEAVVSSVFYTSGNTSPTGIGITDGSTPVRLTEAATGDVINGGLKIWINNTRYLYVINGGAGQRGGYSGVLTK